ncbi:hypothetical protein ACHAXT_001012 [Thalassiosira profunda]
MPALPAAAPRGAGVVLYVDHARHLAPLTLCYHATASRHLTSGRSDVVPPSTTTEVDSAHCPRCLKFCDAASAGAGVCQKDGGGCKDCPVCFSPAAVSIDENAEDASGSPRLVCHYLCGHCKWSSRECGVTSNADKLLGIDASEDAEKQRGTIISEVAKELENCLQQRTKERNAGGDALFQSIANMWTQREQDEQRRKRMIIGVSSSKGSTDSSGGKTWSLQTLEQTLEDKKKDLASSYTQSASPVGKEEVSTAGPTDITTRTGGLPTPPQMAAQMTITTQTPQSRSDLLPLPVAYRARVSRRCRAELAAGRTGILVKPKLNPLEGDTSLRAGHGQWWKKDSSAVHVVPRVQLIGQGGDSTGQRHAALLKVKNPTLNMIRLRISTSSVEGDTDAASIDQSELDNILVDPFAETFVQAELCPPEFSASLAPSDFFELEPADDPFLDIGKGQVVDPSDVRGWNAVSALDALGGDSTSQLRVVATEGDTAWIELILCNASPAKTRDGKLLAVPLALQIEVGNGSWEASLIKRRDISDGEKDLVTLAMVTLLC